MRFNIGDKVDFIDDHRPGIVKAIKGGQLLLEYEDGFDEWVSENLLVRKGGLDIEVDKLPSKDDRVERPASSIRKKERGSLEVDLHIESLLQSSRGLSNHQIVEVQLNAVRRSVAKARKARVKSLILIHGLGDGKLRMEVHQLLNSMERLEYFDASYQKYGGGATEVRFY